MSFRLFIYYCALCGGWAAFLGWAFGELLAPSAQSTRGQLVAIMGVRGMFLGMLVALGLSLVDALWNLSLKRMSQIAMRVGVAVLVGCVGGLIGGILGQLLLNATQVDFLSVIGWILTGLLIGVSIASYEILIGFMAKKNTAGAVKKMTKCLIGGSIGGVLGGVLFLLLGAMIGGVTGKPREDLWSDGATGFTALGMCIGLMVGLAQIILKEAWIKIEAGFRPGREMLLSQETTTIGRAESSDIGLFGDPTIEKTHARIVQVGSQYFVEDAQSPGGTFVNSQRVTGRMPLQSGDLIQVGKSSLRFNERQKQQTAAGA